MQIYPSPLSRKVAVSLTMSQLVWIFVALSIMYNIDGVYCRGCTCQKSTKMECESAGVVSYDGVTQCTWEATHERCRNTNWLECKQDPYCLWIKKTLDDDDQVDECDEDQQDEYNQNEQEIENGETEESNNYLNYGYSADSPNDDKSYKKHHRQDEKEMMVESNASVLSSIHTQSVYIRIFALMIVATFVCFGTIYCFYQNKSNKKDGILSGFGQSEYSTF